MLCVGALCNEATLDITTEVERTGPLGVNATAIRQAGRNDAEIVGHALWCVNAAKSWFTGIECARVIVVTCVVDEDTSENRITTVDRAVVAIITNNWCGSTAVGGEVAKV